MDQRADRTPAAARRLLSPAFAALFLVFAIAPAPAQQNPSDDQQQILRRLQNAPFDTDIGQSVVPQQTILQPTAPSNPFLPTSRLEALMSSRAGTRLVQFGYDQLGVGRAVALPQIGGIQDSYVLGSGDEIVVSLRGQENTEYRVQVDRDGRVVLPRLSPIAAAGRSFGDFRRDLEAAVHRTYVSTQGYVSIGRLRQINVLVSGEVGSPGVRTLTGLSTVVDAVLVSGGVGKRGSLRNIFVLRAGRRIAVDLYGVLTGRVPADQLMLTGGDRIVVPPLGRTVAVTGWVRRPGIYELAGHSSISIRGLLALAGGLEVRGSYRFSILQVGAQGRNQMITVQGEAASLGDSDILFVQPADSAVSSMATLSGGTPLAGRYSTGQTKLSQLLRAPGALGDEPYTLFGIISRRDPVTLLRRLIPFTPVAVLKGSQDIDVQSDDIIRIITTREARLLFAAVQQHHAEALLEDQALRNPRSSELAANMGMAAVGSGAGLLAAPQPDSGQQNALALLGQAGPPVNYGVSPVQPPGVPPAQSPYGNSYPPQYGNPNQTPYPPTPALQGQPYAAPGQQFSGGGGQDSGFGYPQQFAQPMRESAFTPNLQEGSGTPGRVPTNVEVTSVADMADQLRVGSAVLINFLEDRALNVSGAVHGAGLYLVGPDADLQSVLDAAGGLTGWADRSSVEVISTSVDAETGKSRTRRTSLSLVAGTDANFIVSPRDEVRLKSVYTAVGIGSVTVQGQIRHVGTYPIVRGERLSDLLIRAGGLTDDAYPYGTVFLRKSAAEREEDSFRRQAQAIEEQLLTAMSRRDTNSKMAPEAFTALQGYVNTIKRQKGLGRITVAADPAYLAANPALDPLLEAGDVVFVPQRPYSVAVLGEVLQPGNLAYKPELNAADYIGKAGGYSQFADRSETILVLPDGSARRLDRSWFNFGDDTIPPGSTIYVGRDVSGLDLRQMLVDSAAIVSQLAITAASLAVLSRNTGN